MESVHLLAGEGGQLPAISSVRPLLSQPHAAAPSPRRVCCRARRRTGPPATPFTGHELGSSPEHRRRCRVGCRPHAAVLPPGATRVAGVVFAVPNRNPVAVGPRRLSQRATAGGRREGAGQGGGEVATRQRSALDAFPRASTPYTTGLEIVQTRQWECGTGCSFPPCPSFLSRSPLPIPIHRHVLRHQRRHSSGGGCPCPKAGRERGYGQRPYSQ